MILVTGVSGGLGGAVLRGLRAQPDLDVVAGTRSGDGITARHIDFDAPATLVEGFRGVDVLVFVSAGYAEDDVVLARHGAVVAAAAAAGVRHVIYTSLAGSASSATIALPHRWTESQLAAAPFDTTVLRNGLYTDVPVGLAVSGADSSTETGVFAAPFGDSRISVVDRQDLADIAVRVAAEIDRDLHAGNPSPHAGRTYELEGVFSLSGADIADVLSTELDRPVEYQDVPLSALRAGLDGSGLEPYQIGHTISLFSNLKAGFLSAESSDLPALLPTPPRSVREQIVAAVAAGGYASQSISANR